nr:phragmoplast-associated kinesin-related protein [Tanacetum cinerariifolium]
METTIEQQVVLDEALVPNIKRLRIGRSNFRLPSNIQSNESTLQVVYDVLRRCPFFKAFLVTADVVSRHQNTQQYGALLPIELTNDEIRKTKAYKEYYACATEEATPKPKASAKRKRSERYGSLLTLDEFKEFDMISDDYEINWHLRSVINPTSKDLKSRSAKVKNHRRVFMDKLMNSRKFFSEDSMRDREPCLQHEDEKKNKKRRKIRMTRKWKKGSMAMPICVRIDALVLVAFNLSFEIDMVAHSLCDFGGGKMDGLNCFKTSIMNLVDLAATVRQEATGATRKCQKEARHINRSLTQLGNLSNILAEVSHTGKKRHIPYRDSKLRYLLQESLGRNAELAIVYGISPAQRVIITLEDPIINSFQQVVLEFGKFKQWQFWIQQYLQHENYAMWEVIEFGDSYVVLGNTTDTTSGDKSGRMVTLTAEDMQMKKNDVKARTTLLLSLPDEHQLRFSKYKTARELWAAILKTFGGNEATKKTKKNLLKQQYGNFKAKGSETLE